MLRASVLVLLAGLQAARAQDAIASVGVAPGGSVAFFCATTQLKAPERLYRISLAGALTLQSQFDLEMDADKEGYKQTVCSNGAIAVASDTVSYTPMGRLYSEEVPGVPCLVRSSPAAGNGSLISERVELPSNPAQLSLSAGGAIHVMLEGTQNGAGYSPVQLLRLDNFSTAAVLGAVALDLSVVTGPCDSYRIRPAGLQVFGDDNLLALAVYCPSAYGETTFIAIARADSLEVRGSAALTGMPFFPSLLALVHPPSKETRGGLNVSLFLTIGGTACPGYGPRASCSTLHEVCIAIAGDSATPTIVPTNRTAPLWSLQAGSATRFVALQGTESLLNQGGWPPRSRPAGRPPFSSPRRASRRWPPCHLSSLTCQRGVAVSRGSASAVRALSSTWANWRRQHPRLASHIMSSAWRRTPSTSSRSRPLPTPFCSSCGLTISPIWWAASPSLTFPAEQPCLDCPHVDLWSMPYFARELRLLLSLSGLSGRSAVPVAGAPRCFVMCVCTRGGAGGSFILRDTTQNLRVTRRVSAVSRGDCASRHASAHESESIAESGGVRGTRRLYTFVV